MALGVVLACGDPGHLPPVQGVIEGRLLKGPVDGASVSVFPLLGDGSLGSPMGSGVTDASGAFRVEVGNAQGVLVVQATSGRFQEEAAESQVALDATLSAVITGFAGGSTHSGLMVTPVTTFAALLARWDLGTTEGELVATVEAAQALVDAHFLDGQGDSRVVEPLDWTAGGDDRVQDLSAEARHGLVLAGLSALAAWISEQAGVAPGAAINTSVLLRELSQDLRSDGMFDGDTVAGFDDPQPGLTVGTTALDGSSLRSDLGVAIKRFVEGPHNASALRGPDVAAFVDALAGRISRLFPGEGRPLDRDGPVLTWVSPLAGDVLAGVVELEVQIEDVGGNAIHSATFTELTGLVSDGFTPAAGAATGVLVGQYDTRQLADGPRILEAVASDALGNQSAASIAVHVSNHPPALEVLQPTDGAVVSGPILLAARASTDNGVILSMTVLLPDGTELPDEDPSEGNYQALWDTTTGPEGEVVLRFRAQDSEGGLAQKPVRVHVDNRPAATIAGVVTLGVPVAGVEVTPFALDLETGARGAALGPGVLTTEDGRFSLTLANENHLGPVELVARNGVGVAAGRYRDPVSGATIILGSGDELSGLVTDLEPAAAHPGRIIGAWTSLGVSLARNYAYRDATGRFEPLPGAPEVVAEEMIAGHFRRAPFGAPYQLWITPPAQPGGPFEGDEGLAGFAEASLHQLAAQVRERGTNGPLAPQAYAGTHLLRALLLDVRDDGLLDGSWGVPTQELPGVPGTTVRYETETTRRALATALSAFARANEGTTGVPFKDVYPILETIASDDRALYRAEHPPRAWDTVPPTITLETDPPGVDGSVIGSEVVTVTAVATDDSGVQSLVTSYPGLVDLDASAARAVFQLGPDRLPLAGDGLDLIVRLIATDLGGLPRAASLAFHRRAPAIEALDLPAQFAWVTTPVAIRARATFGFDPESFAVTGPGGVLSDSDPSIEGLQASLDGVSGTVQVALTARDLAGQETVLERAFYVDATPPSLLSMTVEHATLHQGTYYTRLTGLTVGGIASDLGAGLDRVELFLLDPAQATTTQAFGACTGDCNFTLSAVLPGAGHYQFKLRVVDKVGLVHETPYYPVVVDDIQPALGLPVAAPVPGFLGEDKVDIEWTDASRTAHRYVPRADAYPRPPHLAWGATTGAPTWPKFETRLRGTTEADAQQHNLPVIYVWMTDAGDVQGPPGTVRVEYRLIRSTTVLRDWSPAAPSVLGQDGLYFVPISTDTISPAILDDLTKALSILEVRATDLAGNSDTVNFGFRLQILPGPPILTPDLGYRTAGDTRSVFTRGFLSATAHQFFMPTAWSGKMRMTRLRIDNPHETPVALELPAGTAAALLHWQRGNGVVAVSNPSYPCTASLDGCDLLLNSYAPCREEWSDPDRTTEYQWLPAGNKIKPGIPGTSNLATCEPFTSVETHFPVDMDSPTGAGRPLTLSPELTKVGAGGTLEAELSPGSRTWMLAPRSAYWLHLGALPQNDTFWPRIHGTYGQHQFDWEVHKSQLASVYYDTLTVDMRCLQNTGQCRGDRTELAHFLSYEKAIRFAGATRACATCAAVETGSVDFDVRTASVRAGAAQTNWRDPTVGKESHPLYWTTAETSARPYTLPSP